MIWFGYFTFFFSCPLCAAVPLRQNSRLRMSYYAILNIRAGIAMGSVLFVCFNRWIANDALYGQLPFGQNNRLVTVRAVGIGGGHGGPCPPPIICTNMPPPSPPKKEKRKKKLCVPPKNLCVPPPPPPPPNL